MSNPETKMVGCAACGATNRVPEARMSADAKCGRCGIALRNGQPAVLTGENFLALGERSDVPLLVDFWAPWCDPCRQMAPAFSAATAELEPALRLAKLNTEVERGLARRFDIRSIPTLMLLHKGREIARQSGAMPTPAIVAWAQRAFFHSLAGNRQSP
jgi:thioredoxin 2